MIGWLKGKLAARPGPGREALLGAVPVKNKSVREVRAGAGESKELGATVLRLTAPLAAGRLRGILGGSEEVKRKSFDLDELGAFVWDAMDGCRTVEALIRHFAEVKRVNLREAEVAVLAFLKTLVRRNLVALAVTNNPQHHPPAKKNRKETPPRQVSRHHPR